VDYTESLHVPLRWWVQGTMLIATFWLAMVIPIPGLLPWVLTAVAMALLAGGFLAYGARISVADGVLRAGKAHIGLEFVGAVEPLDADATRRTAGVDADARAHLVLRPYLKRAVKVEITDPADPAPYWLVSCRRPDLLVSALEAARTR
jgi:hypothetical protein